MKIVYKISLFFAVLLSVSACQLEQYSTSTITVPSPEEAFTSYADAKSFANGMNVYFRSNTYGKFAETADIQGDLFNASRTFGNRGGGPHTMNSNFNAGDYDVKAVWDGYYAGIVDYNYFIHNVDYVYDRTKLNASQTAEIEQWKGNAYFYRAFSYFDLAKKFCNAYESSSAPTAKGLPIIGKFDVNEKPARATLQVTMDSIEKDLAMAATLLSKVKGAANATVPTIDAVNALKARFYLWTKQYQKAIEAADLVINSGKYALSSTINELAKEVYNEAGTESIMQLYSSITEEPRSIGVFLGRYAGWDDSTGEIVHFYSLPDFIPTKKLADMYETTDMRSKIYIAEVNTFIGSFQVYTMFVKFRGNPALTNNDYFDGKCKAKVFRIAEMYLIKAEAQVLGSIGDAAETLNALQLKRGATPTAGTLADVQNEWAKETVGEGMRIECLKRWKIGFDVRVPQDKTATQVQTGPGYTTGIDVGTNLYKYTWPIPTDDMVFNKNLVQNEGWGI